MEMYAMPPKRRVAVIEQEECVACGTCLKVCPKAAISVFKGMYAVVESKLCIGCGMCAKCCPASIITMTGGAVKL